MISANPKWIIDQLQAVCCGGVRKSYKWNLENQSCQRWAELQGMQIYLQAEFVDFGFHELFIKKAEKCLIL